MPSFGGLKSYYLYKPLYIINTHYALHTKSEMPIVRYFTAPLVKISDHSAYYKMKEGYQMIDLLTLSSEAMAKTDYPEVKRWNKIDSMAVWFTISNP